MTQNKLINNSEGNGYAGKNKECIIKLPCPALYLIFGKVRNHEGYKNEKSCNVTHKPIVHLSYKTSTISFVDSRKRKNSSRLSGFEK